MASSNLGTGIDSRLEEMFIMILEKTFSVLSVLIVADLPRLPSVRRIFNFLRLSGKDCLNHFVNIYLNIQNQQKLHMYAENEPNVKRNENILNYFLVPITQ